MLVPVPTLVMDMEDAGDVLVIVKLLVSVDSEIPVDEDKVFIV